MKAIWTGAIGFGLVNIPVGIFSAVSESNLDLDMLDRKDHARIRYKRVNEETGKEVPWEQIVKGYDYKGKYVVLTNEDMENASPEKTKIINITDFVEAKEIESIFYETPYYLAPMKSGDKAYGLLREALKKTGKVGLGSFVMRNKESLCVLKPFNNVILLQKIRFAEEIRDESELKIPGKLSIGSAEMQMATALIKQHTAPFKIDKYKDTYRQSLLKLIQEKSKGKKIEPHPLRVVHTRTNDLMSQLKASLGTKRKRAS